MKSKNEIRQEELEKEIKISYRDGCVSSEERRILKAKTQLKENKLAVKNEREEVLKLINGCHKDYDNRISVEELKQKLEKI